MTLMLKTRVEKDSMGELEIPADAYYGVQTQRAVHNFPITGWKTYPELISAIAHVKKAATAVNLELGLLDPKKGKAILQAADELLQGNFHEDIVVDIFQAGAGTSLHMNINEVIANRAIELLGGQRGDYKKVGPIDDVNYGQSTNDVIPTAMRLAVMINSKHFVPVLENLRDAFAQKAKEFDHVVKSGRTHMQDAVPIRLGQEFGAYASILDTHIVRYRRVLEDLKVLGIGGTAVGTGLNAHPQFRHKVCAELSRAFDLQFTVAEDLVAMTQFMSPFVAMSGVLRNFALDMIKISNDLRLMTSGPKTGLSEISLPACQPGSSIMPAKVNPVMPEMLTIVCFQVLGNDQAICYASQAGQFELNVMTPLVIFDIMMSLKILENAVRVFTDKCVVGITANEDRCRHFAERSAALITALNNQIGYMNAAAIEKEALSAHKSIRQIVLEKKLMSEAELQKALDLDAMTRCAESKT